jgi:S-DNA-T family DNA segregation ATPase FtsK/SpoIIIE
MSVRLFQRPPRLREIVEPVELSLPLPPNAPKNYPRTPIFQLLLMAMLPTLLPPVVLGLVTYYAGAGQTMVITSMALAGSLGVAVTVTTLLSRKDEDGRVKMDQREYEAQRRRFEQEMQFVAHDARVAVAREHAILEREFASPDAVKRRTLSLSASTWERRRKDADFLELRLGTGRRRTCMRIPREALRSGDAVIAGLHEEIAFHEVAPITARLLGAKAGVFGADHHSFASWLVAQAAALHTPSDLRIALFSKDTSWGDNLKWLPHCRQTQGQVGALVASTSPGARQIASRITAELSLRGDHEGPAFLVVLDGCGWPGLSADVDGLLRADHAGLAVLQLQSSYEALFDDCGFVVDLSDPARAMVLEREEREQPLPFVADGLTADAEREIALALAPLAVVQVEDPTSIPEALPLADVLGSPEAADIKSAWRRSRSEFRLSAPIGRGAGGKTVSIDFRKDGPHALLAGTTGSGKSEFLQSLVASFAARIPPDLLNFLLIDYKGGSAFQEVEALPHVVGVVTDLDERLSARALTSLRAEMKRREHLLNGVGAANITEYQARPRAIPLANLIILIDEFHRLVSEVPDFVDQMIQIAQQGRSLGVHLLLSTQKPSGVVSDYIRSNTNLRMCLRVTDEADSRDVLGSVEAAHIGRNMPGRLFVRRGNEALEPCQAGRLSTPYTAGASVRADWFVSAPPRACQIGSILMEEVTPNPHDISVDGTADYRALLIAAIGEAAEQMGTPSQQPPWQPYLPDTLALEELQADPSPKPPLCVTVGIVDEPEAQSQQPLQIDLAAGHVLVAGAGNTGKTQTLLTIAAAAARAYGRDRVHAYGIDFGGGDLAALSSLPHCGGVAMQSDPAAVQWVVGMIRETVHQRLAGEPIERPHVLTLIDNFGAFYASLQTMEDGPDTADQFLELMDVGRSVGVTFAVTTEQPASLRQSVIALMSTRVVFELADEEQYSYVGLQRVARSPQSIPGRGLLPGHVAHQVQIAISSPGRFSEATSGPGPLKIAPLPTRALYPVREPVSDLAEVDGLHLGLQDGLAAEFVRPADEHLVIAGSHGSGRSNALAVVVHELERNNFTRVFVLNPRRSAVLRAAANADACVYAERADDLIGAWDAIDAELRARLQTFEAGESISDRWAVVLDDAELAEPSASGSEALRILVQRGIDVGATVVMAVEPQAARSAYGFDALRTLVGLQAGILLRPSTTDDFAMFGVRGKPSRTPAGRGYACFGGEKRTVQLFAVAE